MTFDNSQRICFIGAGNMAQAIMSGLINNGVAPAQIRATARTESTQKQVTDTLAVLCDSDNIAACQDANVVVLAVKPQGLKAVCEQLKEVIQPGALIISVAAGIRAQSLEAWLGPKALVRCMPNTPSSIGLGASGYYCNGLVSEQQKVLAQQILSAVGLAIEVMDEAQIDAVTAVSGSGPAYFFLFIESMIDAGVKLGLSREQASLLAQQTARGAAELAAKSSDDVSTLRNKVTSPNGTTQRAIETFEAAQLRDIVDQAMTACAQRADELSTELGS